jgi:PAS domain-containing protein
MTSLRHSFAELSGFLILLLAGSLWFGNTLNRGLEKEIFITAKRLERAFYPLLLKAHRSKDDLALQEAVSALAQSPGIKQAGILDQGEKIIAHNRLDQLGKTFNRPKGRTRLIRFPLKEEAGEWGTLFFLLDTPSLSALKQNLFLKGGLFCGGLLAFFAWWLGMKATQLKRRGEALADETTVRMEKERQIERLQSLAETSASEQRVLFDAVLEQLGRPVLVLDCRQRVAGMNSSAKKQLGLMNEPAQLSWLDIPDLRDHGMELERSLKNKGCSITLGSNATLTSHDQVTWLEWPRRESTV